MNPKACYQLTQIADDDLTNIWKDTATQWGKTRANQYLQALESCFILLAENPNLGKKRPEIKAGYRSMVKNKHLIFYRHFHTHIEIVRVLHQRMEIKDHT